MGTEHNVLVQAKDYSGGEIYLDHDEKDLTTINYLKKFKRSNKNIKRLYLDDIHGIIAGVRNGLGRAIVPLHLIKNEKSLIIVNPKDSLDVPVYLYYFNQPFYSQLHQAIVAELSHKFKEALN